MKKRILKQNRGFTLVEIIVVLVILAILAAFTIPAMLGFVQDAREKQVYTEIREVALASQSAYEEIYAKYPIQTTGSSVFRGAVDYTKGSITGPQWDKDFIAKVKSLLNSDVSFDNILGITVDKDMLWIHYSKNGNNYSYYKTPAQDPTITKY